MATITLQLGQCEAQFFFQNRPGEADFSVLHHAGDKVSVNVFLEVALQRRTVLSAL